MPMDVPTTDIMFLLLEHGILLLTLQKSVPEYDDGGGLVAEHSLTWVTLQILVIVAILCLFAYMI